ncbi:MAG: EamA/RhaT family transporter [Acidobacteriaceae bacterium]|nr:EamA/RhaT family transporter [Acidobacteriaceae bacterium]
MLVKDALRDISPLLFNLLRMIVATVVLAAIYHRDLLRLKRSYLAGGVIVGLCLAAGYSFQTAGLARTTPAKSAFITGMIVVLVPLLCIIPALRPATMRRPTLAAFAGALLAFAGILLLTTPANVPPAALFGSINTGDLLTLLCALGFALHVLALAHISPRLPLGTLAVLQMAACTLVMALVLPAFEHPRLHVSGRLVIAVLIAGVLATALAFTVQSWAQQRLSATRTALILALEPVFAFLTSYLFAGERLSGRASAGALLILGGIALTELLPLGAHAAAHEAPVP